MTFKQKFFSKLALCLVGAFLVSELLTKFIFYPTTPVTKLSFRIWLAQKKQQIATLPEIFRKKPTLPLPKLPPPVIYKPPTSPSPTRTPYPKQPTPSPKLTPTPLPTPTKSPSPPPFYSPTPRPSPSPTLTPSPHPTPTPTPPDIKDAAMELVRVINEERAKQGLNSLGTPNLLMQAAQIYVEDLAKIDKCGHEVPGKGFIWDYAKRAGYQGTGLCEVIACHPSSARQAVDMWMDDAPHRDCIMNPAAGSVGAGVSGYYWLAGIFK